MAEVLNQLVLNSVMIELMTNMNIQKDPKDPQQFGSLYHQSFVVYNSLCIMFIYMSPVESILCSKYPFWVPNAHFLFVEENVLFIAKKYISDKTSIT